MKAVIYTINFLVVVWAFALSYLLFENMHQISVTQDKMKEMQIEMEKMQIRMEADNDTIVVNNYINFKK